MKCCPARNIPVACCYHRRTWYSREYPVTYDQCCQCHGTPPAEPAPKPTAQGVRALGGGEALPNQGQSEGTP